MKQGLLLLLSWGYYTLSPGVFLNSAMAQVNPDGTTNTTVDVNGSDFTIEQGDRAGGNLFHSFSDFSVPNGGSAFFNNAADIVNIFSRVTGGNISNIDGLLGANGAANLFLINPAGIIFGAGARLDIGGSFYGSSADSIIFPDGEFSSTDLTNPPLLTINAPIGLSFRDNPGDIVNRSQFGLVETNIDELVGGEFTVRDSVGLQVNPGQNINLVGGNVILENAAGITASGGGVEIGGLSEAGEILIDANGTLTFPDNIAKADVSLSGQSRVNVTAANGGFINVNARNLLLTEQSELYAGIREDSGSPDAQVGDIVINATESVKIIGSGGVAGKPFILLFNDYDTAIRNLVGLRPNTENRSGGQNNLGRNPKEFSTAVGNAGSIIVNTNSLELINRGSLTTKNYGQGNLSDIRIQANNILIDGGDVLNQIVSGEGNAGAINIDTSSLEVTNFSFIIANSGGREGNAGDVIINASNFVNVLDRTQILTQVEGSAEGNSGDIIITTPILNLDGNSKLASDTIRGTRGSAGDIIINTDSLRISDRARIDARTSNNFEAGDVQVNTNTLELIDGGRITTENISDSSGNAGTINVFADNVVIDGITLDSDLDTGLFADSFSAGVTGISGNISVTANSLNIQNGGAISATTQSDQGGVVTLNIDDRITLRNESFISSAATEGANGGLVNINSNFIIAFPQQNNDILASANQGQGGNINIRAEALFGIEERSSTPPNQTNDIDASSEFGLDGNVSILTPDINRIQTEIELPSSPIEAEQTVAQACQSDRFAGKTSGLTLKGKGGIPSLPTNPFNSETILVEDETTPSNIQAQTRAFLRRGDFARVARQYPEIQPIATSNGNIYPARGIIKTESGKIILTAYATDNLNTRTPKSSANCSPISEQ